VEHVGRRRSSRKLAVHRNVERIDDVLDPHLRRDGVRELVDVAVDAGVGVAIDDAGRDMLAAPVDCERAGPVVSAVGAPSGLPLRADIVGGLEDRFGDGEAMHRAF
jgi:hypothetical protein